MSEAQVEAVRDAVAPALAGLGLDLYDVEVLGGAGARTLRVTVAREGGVDLDTITAATQAVSPVVEHADAINGPYLLEVSSPGVERSLRRPEHFRGASGEVVSIKFHTPDGPRRVRGTLTDVSDTQVVVDSEEGEHEAIALADITQARTVFEWGPKPRPKGSKR
jgi:ribosome maturation factor RimP